MSGELFKPTELDTWQLNGRSLTLWHRWLTTDRNGEPIGWAKVPCSRYGATGDEVAWWAVAASIAHTEAAGRPNDPEELTEYLMMLAVNDHPDIAAMVDDAWHFVPEELQDRLGTHDDIRELRS